MKQLIDLFTALADASRLRILNLLLASEGLCVCDIEAALDFTQTKVSRHMRYLRERGLVRVRRSGRWMYYSLTPDLRKERENMLAELRSMMKSMNQPASDLARLSRRIRSGCCRGIPANEFPATFKFTK